MIQQTSLESYKAIIPTLSDRQKVVFDVINEHHGMSNHDISRFLGLEINCVTPRVNELRDLGVVDLFGFKTDKLTDRKVMCWEALE